MRTTLNENVPFFHCCGGRWRVEFFVFPRTWISATVSIRKCMELANLFKPAGRVAALGSVSRVFIFISSWLPRIQLGDPSSLISNLFLWMDRLINSYLPYSPIPIPQDGVSVRPHAYLTRSTRRLFLLLSCQAADNDNSFRSLWIRVVCEPFFAAEEWFGLHSKLKINYRLFLCRADTPQFSTKDS